MRKAFYEGFKRGVNLLRQFMDFHFTPAAPYKYVYITGNDCQLQRASSEWPLANASTDLLMRRKEAHASIAKWD